MGQAVVAHHPDIARTGIAHGDVVGHLRTWHDRDLVVGLGHFQTRRGQQIGAVISGGHHVIRIRRHPGGKGRGGVFQNAHGIGPDHRIDHVTDGATGPDRDHIIDVTHARSTARGTGSDREGGHSIAVESGHVDIARVIGNRNRIRRADAIGGIDVLGARLGQGQLPVQRTADIVIAVECHQAVTKFSGHVNPLAIGTDCHITRTAHDLGRIHALHHRAQQTNLPIGRIGRMDDTLQHMHGIAILGGHIDMGIAAAVGIRGQGQGHRALGRSQAQGLHETQVAGTGTRSFAIEDDHGTGGIGHPENLGMSASTGHDQVTNAIETTDPVLPGDHGTLVGQALRIVGVVFEDRDRGGKGAGHVQMPRVGVHGHAKGSAQARIAGGQEGLGIGQIAGIRIAPEYHHRIARNAADKSALAIRAEQQAAGAGHAGDAGLAVAPTVFPGQVPTILIIRPNRDQTPLEQGDGRIDLAQHIHVFATGDDIVGCGQGIDFKLGAGNRILLPVHFDKAQLRGRRTA